MKLKSFSAKTSTVCLFVFVLACATKMFGCQNEHSLDGLEDRYYVHQDNLWVTDTGEYLAYSNASGELMGFEALFCDEQGFYFLKSHASSKHACPKGHYSPNLAGLCTVRDCPYYYQKHIKRL